ncbi:MAG: carboxypeptidase-like regulatory domain-containing protein [Bacteroidota bacterium]
MNLRTHCTHYLLGLLLLIPALLSAQQQEKLLYRINAQEYETILLSAYRDISFLQTRTPVATLTKAPEDSTLAAGHYVIISLAGEQIKWELWSKNHHSIYLHDDQKQLNLAIVDSVGQEVPHAQVRFAKRRVDYKQANQRYESRRLRPGILSIYLPGDTIFYEIETAKRKSIVLRRFGYFSGSRVGSVITWPIRLIRGPIGYLRRGFRWGDWHIHNWPFERLYRRIKAGRDARKVFNGFVASQQPLYRHGDTVKIAATLAKANGRPYHRPLRLLVRSVNKTWVDTLLQPELPGHYAFEWPLADSLPLDSRYIAKVQDPRWRQYRSIQHEFRLEDYELDGYEFEITQKPNLFLTDEPVRFTVSAKDANGLAIPTADMAATIVTQQVNKLFDRIIYVPDTLWTFRQEMGNQTELTLEPPDSIWPLVHLSAQLEVYLRGPSGELQKASHSFQVRRNPWQPKLTLSEGQVKTDLIPASAETRRGILRAYNKEQILQRREISSGAEVPLNPTATRYEWEVAGKRTEMHISKVDDGVDFDYRWKDDSLSLQWTNTHRLPIHWTLQTSRQMIAEGRDSSQQIAAVFPVGQNKRQLWLHYSYYWGGRSLSLDTDLKALRNQLKVELEVPDRIYPGEDRTIQVQVTDDMGRAVKGAPVLVGAYNAQMRKGKPYELTDIKYKGRRQGFRRQSYYAKRARPSSQTYISRAWYNTLGLDSLLYYQLRKPGQGVFTHYRPLQSQDSLARVTAQIAPFVVRDNRAIPVHFIYLDNRLVYVSKAWQDTPYSIVAEPGYHQLTLRTSKAEIRIDSVLLQAGEQLVLSVDQLQVKSKQVQVLARSPEWTNSEIKLVERHLLFLGSRTAQQRPQYFFASPKQVFLMRDRRYGTQPVGVFSNGQELTRLRPGIDTTQFRFEPHFYYEIDQQRDRLYRHHPYSEARVKPSFYTWQLIPALGEEAIFLADIKAPKNIWRYDYDEPSTKAANGRGRLRLFAEGRPRNTKALLLSEGDTLRYVLAVVPTTISLPEGQYTLNWFTGEDQLGQYAISIRANHTLALRVDSTQLTSKVLPNDWGELLLEKKYPAGSTRPSSITQRSKERPTRTFVGTGQLISGYITDDGGEPLIGASVLIKGTAVGTVTDWDGYYQLWAPAAGVEIIISYTGFETQEVILGSNAGEIDIVLSEGVALDEVVVVAYSMNRVREDNFGVVPVLQGKVAGVLVAEKEVNDQTAEQLAIQPSPLPAPTDSIRDSFRDYVYWQPVLATDKNGKVQFTTTFPDDITNWRHFALTTDRKARLGLQEAYTQAYLPLQAQLYTPRFLRPGDRSEVIGLLSNRTGSPQQLTSFFTNWNGERREEELEIEEALRQIYPLGGIPTADSLSLKLGLIQGDYRDGEERIIPVYPKGIERTKGHFTVLKDQQGQGLEADLDKGNVHLHIGGNALPQIQAAIEKLRNYPHGCNEQTASRLLALLANEQLKAYNDDLPDVSAEIRAEIRRLEKNRHRDRRWGWWPASLQSSDWITRHVIRALDQAKAQGYRIPDLEVPIREMISQLSQLNKFDQWDNLLFLAERGQVLDYEPYLIHLDTIPRDLATELLYRRLQQLSGAPFKLDSLTRQRQQTFTGGTFWGKRNRWHYSPYRYTTGLSIQALQLYRATDDSSMVTSIEQFFLEPSFTEAATDYYHLGLNTYEASLLVQQLLPSVLREREKISPLQVQLSGGGTTQVFDDFPEQRMISPQRARQSTIRKTGNGPAFVSYYQRYWDEKPPVEDAGFEIRSSIYQNGTASTNITTGTTAQLRANVTVDKDADYVKIEIPVPGGCSYGPKVFGEIHWETHREYRRDRVVVYCEHLPAGNYNFTIPLEPRFAGQYHTNPAQAEMMYIPAVHGIGNTLQLVIE